jgi:hypothetical protein
MRGWTGTALDTSPRVEVRQAMAERRARRSDAGLVAVTQRDVAILGWVGEMAAVREDLLPLLLARLAPEPATAELSTRTARGWVDRMTRAGYVTRHRILGRRWVVASRRGLRLVGLVWEPWDPSAWALGHRHATAVVRLALEAGQPGAVWTSERALRSQWAGTRARVRIPDGTLHLADGQQVGVEVELARKRPAARYGPVVRETIPDLAGVWWFTRPGDVAWLGQVLAEHGAAGHAVYQLPDGAVS